MEKNGNIFTHNSGAVIEIKQDYSVADVTLLMCFAELTAQNDGQLLNSVTAKIVVDEFKNHFNNYPEDKIIQLIEVYYSQHS